MIVFLLQSLFLIAAAFVVGAIIGSLWRRSTPNKESVSDASTRAADARLSASTILPANDDVRQSAREAAAMIPPAEPVPPAEPEAVKGVRKSSARKTVTKEPAKRVKNPRQSDEHRPVTLKQARRAKPDALNEIDGIGSAIQARLFDLGIFHFDQIAGWSLEEASWVSEEIGFPGRVLREDWIRQAAARVPAAPPAPKTRKTTKVPEATPTTRAKAASARKNGTKRSG